MISENMFHQNINLKLWVEIMQYLTFPLSMEKGILSFARAPH